MIECCGRININDFRWEQRNGRPVVAAVRADEGRIARGSQPTFAPTFAKSHADVVDGNRSPAR
jgi:hypothetical protein